MICAKAEGDGEAELMTDKWDVGTGQLKMRDSEVALLQTQGLVRSQKYVGNDTVLNMNLKYKIYDLY